jgi:hypothetical protein
VGQWEPLAERIPVDMRRLATQLRRMKDRSALTVPALAARTAHPVEGWERAFAGRQLPPLDAVEVLAQASGADYDRIGALWRLAEKAVTGSGDRGRGREIPYPDPLDPLGPDEGLPRQHRRAVLLATLGLLAAASLVAVLFMAGTSTGRSPGGRADGVTGGAPAVPKGATTPGAAGSAGSAGATAPTAGGAGVPGRSSDDASGAPRPVGGDRPSAAMDSLSPSASPPRMGAAPGGTTQAAAGGAAAGAGTAGGTGGSTHTAGTASAPVTAPAPAPVAPTGGGPSPSPSPRRLCLGLIVIGLCVN